MSSKLIDLEYTTKSKKETDKPNLIILILFGLYLILKPFYFWSSGLPQVSDFIMVIAIIYYSIIKQYKYKVTNKNILFICFLFLLYIILVNLIWSLILNSSQFIIPTIYHIYNVIIFIFTSNLILQYKQSIYKTFFYTALISITIQVIIFLLSEGGTFRNSGSFNNPNQLGYYSLLIASMIIITRHSAKKSISVLYGLLMSLIVVFSSLSKAAILSYAVLTIIFVIKTIVSKDLRKKYSKWLIVMATSVLIININTDVFENSTLLSSVESRISSIGIDEDDSLEGRGYDRIYNYPEYWVFGSGEGNYERFGTLVMEFHSTLGNIQVSYGIIGLILFLLLLHLSLKQDKYDSWYIIFVLLLYGFTHNGIRNSIFWIMLSLISTSNKLKEHN